MINRFFDSLSWDLIKKYRKDSIFVKYFIQIFLVVILPTTFFFVIIIVNTMSNANKEFDNSLDKTFIKSGNYINMIFDNVDKFYKRAIAGSDLYYFMTTPNRTTDSKNISSPIESFNGSVNSFCYYTNGHIKKVYVYSDFNDYVFAFAGGSSGTTEQFRDKAWLDNYFNNDRNDYIAEINNELVFCYKVESNMKNIGAIAVILDTKKLNEALMTDDLTERITIRNSLTGQRIYDTGEVPGKTIEKSMTLNNEKLNVTLYMSTADISKNKTKNIIWIVTAVAATALLALFFACWCAKKQYKTIVDSITAIEKYEYEYSDINEIGYMVIKSRGYALDAKKTEEELVKKISKLKKAQVVALQSQIDSHFILNALNLINSTIIEENGEDTAAVNMIKQFSILLNSCLHIEEYTIPIEKEIKTAQVYADFMMVKYDGKFDIIWHIDRSIYGMNIAKSVFQPIIENAILHGVLEITDGRRGVVDIYAYRVKDRICIKIRDNGKGMTKEESEKLKNNLASDNIFKNMHVGLGNIESRIKILYGEEFGLKIASGPDGTEVSLILPFDINE